MPKYYYVHVKSLTFVIFPEGLVQRPRTAAASKTVAVSTDFTLKNVPPQGYIVDSFSPYCATPLLQTPPPCSPPPALLSFPCPLDLAD